MSHKEITNVYEAAQMLREEFPWLPENEDTRRMVEMEAEAMADASGDPKSERWAHWVRAGHENLSRWIREAQAGEWRVKVDDLQDLAALVAGRRAPAVWAVLQGLSQREKEKPKPEYSDEAVQELADLMADVPTTVPIPRHSHETLIEVIRAGSDVLASMLKERQ